MKDKVKLREAVEEAKTAFWETLDGETDHPIDFGVEVMGYVKTFDVHNSYNKLADAGTSSYGKGLQDFMEENSLQTSRPAALHEDLDEPVEELISQIIEKELENRERSEQIASKMVKLASKIEDVDVDQVKKEALQ